jgi:hypothetical protein
MILVVVAALTGGTAVAQDAPAMSAEEKAAMEAFQRAGTPGKEHAKMEAMAGEYTITVTSYPAPGADPMVSRGTASRKMIMGGRHLEEIVRSSFMGQTFEGRGVTGFNNITGTWWGTWIDNMSTGVAVSHGSWDTGVGIFFGEYIDPATKEIQETKTVVTMLEGGDERMEMFMLLPTGEFKSMEILYERR